MAKDLPFSELEDEYRRYLQEARALSPRSIKTHVKIFRRFGRFLRTRRIRSARRVTVDLVYQFLEESAAGCGRSWVKGLHGSARYILRFLHFVGEIDRDVSGEMMTPRAWKLTGIPKAFATGEVARMLASFRGETPYDHRERLVVLLFICYGLRLGEVTRLTLNDIDSRTKAITIRERRNRVPLVLPLLPAVDEALRGYLAHFRPCGLKTRRLFVNIKHRTGGPLKEPAIHLIVKQFLHRCGLEGSATKFRHTLATRLVNSGTRLEIIQGVLGHRRSDSTRIYAKIDLEKLREVAQNYSLSL